MDRRRAARRVVVVYRDPLLRDIVTGVLVRHPWFRLVGAFAIQDLRPEDVARLAPTDLVVDQEVVDEAADRPKVDLVWRALTYSGPKRLVVVGMTDSCIRILSRHDWSNPSEAELASALSAA
jgi:hypothetical protein